MMRHLILLISLSVTARGSDVIGTFGRSVTIDCNLPFSENFVWDSTDGNVIAIKGRPVMRNSSKYAIERQNGVRESLVIHALTLADDKVYRCYDLGKTDIKELSTVTVLVRPYHMNMTSPTGPVNEGSEVSLPCQADGGKPLPDIRWYMIDAKNETTELIGTINDVMFTNGTGRRINTLTFNVTRNHYNATFVCNVTVSVFFEETFAAALDIQLLPRSPVISGFDGIYDDNETVHVACTSSGSKPTATVMWFWNGIPVGDFEVVVIPEDDGTSVVTSYFRRRLSRAMNGTILTCAVTNSVMLDLNLESASTNVTLLISYRPNITVESNDVITATSGDFITVRYNVDSRPAPYKVKLLKNGVEVERSLYKIEHRNDSKRYDVMIPRVSRAFVGNYSLSATNRLGTNVSTAVQLNILYMPQCASSRIQKQAIHVNKSVHLLCRMFASPSDVTMTWRYRHTRTVISITTATKDNTTSKEQVFGEIEFDASSLLQYTDTYMECYGTNSVGQSTEPCVFQLVHPGPPVAPSNCTINQQAYFVCQPSFDGGSTQTYSLQRLFGTDYQTVFNQSTSEFNLWTFGLAGNVTIRMCSVNLEYPDQFSCTSAFEADLDGILTAPTKAEEVNTAAFIAGGLVAFIGLLCIASIIIFILRKKQKKHHSSDSSEEKQKSSTIKMIKERFFDCTRKATHDEATDSAMHKTRHTNENCVENKEKEVQELKVISSTPCFTKQNRINAINKDAVEILRKFESLNPQSASGLHSDVCMDVTYANGVILSPIVKYHKIEAETNSVEMFEIQETLDGNTTVDGKTDAIVDVETVMDDYSKADIADVLDNETIGKSYSKSDIADVLDTWTNTEFSTNPTEERTPTDIATLLPDQELSVNGTLSLNLDYSAADIASALDKIDTEETTKTSAENTDSDARTFPDSTYIEVVDEATLSSFSECDTALGLSRTFSFMNTLQKPKSYLTHSTSSPDLTRSDVFLSDASSKSCCSLHNVSGGKLTVRRLSESDIEKESATSLDSYRINKLQTNTSSRSSQEVVCGGSIDDFVQEYTNECAIDIPGDKDTYTTEETTIW